MGWNIGFSSKKQNKTTTKKHLFLDLFGIHVYAWRKPTGQKQNYLPIEPENENDVKCNFFKLQNHLQQETVGKTWSYSSSLSCWWNSALGLSPISGADATSW